MGLFNKLKGNQYVDNMAVLSKTNLSLLNTLNDLQSEYDKLFEDNQKLKVELAKIKAR